MTALAPPADRHGRRGLLLARSGRLALSCRRVARVRAERHGYRRGCLLRQYGRRLGPLDAADQKFELGDLVLEGGLADLGEGDPGAGALAGVALLYGDEPGVFQHAEVLGQVACGQRESVAQVAELHLTRLAGDGEDAEPPSLMHDPLDPVPGPATH